MKNAIDQVKEWAKGFKKKGAPPSKVPAEKNADMEPESESKSMPPPGKEEEDEDEKSFPPKKGFPPKKKPNPLQDYLKGKK